MVAEPNAKSGAARYSAGALAITSSSMLRVQPPFAWRRRKRANVQFVASTWQVDVGTQAGEWTPLLRVSLPYAITMASGVQLKEG